MRPKEESQVEQRKIYEDIALRTEGDIYIGVVRSEEHTSELQSP